MTTLLIPSPARIWKEDGVSVCGSCLLTKRCISVYTGAHLDYLCEGCLVSEISRPIVHLVLDYFDGGKAPKGAREQLLHAKSTPHLAHDQLMRAIGYRYYWTPKELRKRGWGSMERAVNHHAHPALWLLDEPMPRWLWRIIQKVPGDRIRNTA